MATVANPVNIRPRPSISASSDGVTNQTHAPRRRPMGPLVFVNSSDLNTDSERRSNRKMVKKWAMLNRNTRHLRPSTSEVKAQFLSWDSRDITQESTVCSPDADDDLSEIRESRATSIATTISDSATPSPFEISPQAAHKFDNLCIDTDDHAKRLLEYFLEGLPGDVEAPSGHLITFNRLVFPTISNSPAALYCLIALLESSPHTPARSGSKHYHDYYLSMALTHTNTLIKNMDIEPTPAVFFCVISLMWISRYFGDQAAISLHFNGMTALTVCHWEMFTATPHFRNGPLFWTFPTNEGNILPSRAEPSLSCRPNLEMLCAIASSNFTLLRDDGLISPSFVSALPHILAMQALLPSEANNHTISVEMSKDLISYILYNGRTLKTLDTHATSPLEHCVAMAATICYYASVFRDSAEGVGWLAEPMQQHLMNLDLPKLLQDYPQVLLWLVLSAGPFAKGFAREWWLDLLVSARNAMWIHSFEDATSVLDTRLLWTHNCDNEASTLWDDATAVMAGFSLDLLCPDLQFDDSFFTT